MKRFLFHIFIIILRIHVLKLPSIYFTCLFEGVCGCTPVEYVATETKKVWFCGCKQSKNKPMCDGTHKKLPEDAEGEAFDPDSV